MLDYCLAILPEWKGYCGFALAVLEPTESLQFALQCKVWVLSLGVCPGSRICSPTAGINQPLTTWHDRGTTIYKQILIAAQHFDAPQVCGFHFALLNL